MEQRSNTTNRLTAKSDNKIKTTWNIKKKGAGKVHSTEHSSSLFVKDTKLNDPKNVANACNYFILNITKI